MIRLKVEQLDVRKMTDAQKADVIRRYTSAGWTFNGGWDLSIHQWLSFTWPFETPPPKM